MRDRPSKSLFRTGHRLREPKRVVSALFDLLLLQQSEVPVLSRRAKALLSLLLRETAALRAEEAEWAQKAEWEITAARKYEAHLRRQRARRKLGLSLDAAPDPTQLTGLEKLKEREAKALLKDYEDLVSDTTAHDAETSRPAAAKTSGSPPD